MRRFLVEALLSRILLKFPFMTGKSERSDIILGRQLIWCFQCQGHGVFTHLSLRASEICTAKKTKDDYMSPKRKDWKGIVRKKHMIPKLWSPNSERTCGQAATPFITDGCAFVEPTEMDTTWISHMAIQGVKTSMTR